MDDWREEGGGWQRGGWVGGLGGVRRRRRGRRELEANNCMHFRNTLATHLEAKVEYTGIILC